MSPDAPTPDMHATTDGQLFAGRYQLLDKLGEGGMGTVFRARDNKLDRPVALKLLPAGSVHDAEAVARFRREAKALARLSHPGIIQAFDSGEDGDRHFLVMEFIEGRSLAKVLADGGAVAPTRAADYAHQAALALQHAHQNGLIHRDVKPSNLLLASPVASAPGGTVKLLDLGLARFLQDQVGDASLTREGAGMGTPDYCPPEQFRDAHKADPRSDIYSLGCTLYHLSAGRVPFPGSSLSEKVTAHEQKEPAPLEEVCPDMPAGLALVVQRMMAKRPADRFQSMAEVVAALAPYVATSSASFQDIRKTSTWTGAQLATMPGMLRRRRVLPWLVAGAALLSLLALGLIGLAAGWFQPKPQQVAQQLETSPGSTEKPALPPADTAKPKPSEGLKPLDDPNVLTVSQEEKDGGQYRTINSALDKIRPGQTIRVLDGGVYQEMLAISSPNQHHGITIEASHGAVLQRGVENGIAVLIQGVPGVTLRGFRLRSTAKEHAFLIGIVGHAAGTVLEQLELEGGKTTVLYGVEVEQLGLADGDAPLIVQDCVFRNLGVGIRLSGVKNDGRAPDPIRRVMIRNNRFARCHQPVGLRGSVRDVFIVGNLMWNASGTGIQVENVLAGTDHLLIANNTLLECLQSIRLLDDKEKKAWGDDVRIRNNLILGSPQEDVVFLDRDETSEQSRGDGDGAALLKAWRFDHNGRDWKPAAGVSAAKSWVPPGSQDLPHDKLTVRSRNSSEGVFLRPENSSPLASAGAGTVDPSLPSYVGALPPEGTDPWNWDRTWRMPKDPQLLTVSKEASGGGEYRTINDALKKVKPWATIRVLDAGTYEEAISLTDRKKHEGLTLEAVKSATLHMDEGVRRLVTIADVPHVYVTGFKFTEGSSIKDAGRAFVLVSGGVPGVALTRLEMTPSTAMLGVFIQNAAAPPGGPPLRIERCTIRPSCPLSNDGISVVGGIAAEPAGGIAIRDNRISNSLRGVNLHGHLRDIHVTGNLMVKCPGSGVQVEDLSPASRGLLLANNTAFNNGSGLRVWDNKPYEEPTAGQVEVVNNLFFGASNYDMAYILDPGMGKDQMPGDSEALLKLWRFHHNRRDFLGAASAASLPAAGTDDRLKRDDLLSTAEDELDRVRPGKDSPLASQGAGTKDGSLPAYIGALPLEGTPPWDWERTWRARVKKPEDRK